MNHTLAINLCGVPKYLYMMYIAHCTVIGIRKPVTPNFV